MHKNYMYRCIYLSDDMSNSFLLAIDVRIGEKFSRVGSEVPRGAFKEQEPVSLSLPLNCLLRKVSGRSPALWSPMMET